MPYYLSKAATVVAVEANPVLAKALANQYQKEIQSGRLIIENKCITGQNVDEKEIEFYIHRYHSGLSTLNVPKNNSYDYKKIRVIGCSFKDLITTYGAPDMVKIDLEGADLNVLESIHQNPPFPDYISVENCGPETLNNLLKFNKYSRFNIVSFYNFKSVYGYTGIDTAGPFGADIKSPWLSREKIIEVFDQMPDPWFDIHATSINFPLHMPDLNFYQKKINLLLWLKSILPNPLKSLIKKIIGFSR
ncbi:hypothetical protein L0U88_20245 [Flavihumibacter sp. RY-1]|uniref:FkbM family methyltransferase n=1 Tax=Flavihumibacter fluminis TaxID=2909236 RepID=A0ABS9BMN8_9BACT|nr:hypothetical protein [Flavihumibacter fluminis]